MCELDEGEQCKVDSAGNPKNSLGLREIGSDRVYLIEVVIIVGKGIYVDDLVREPLFSVTQMTRKEQQVHDFRFEQ